MLWSDADAALFAAVLGQDAAHHLATAPPHLDGLVSSSAELQARCARLQEFVERGAGTWTYGIYWQESRAGNGSGAGTRPVLAWGDGHRHGATTPQDADQEAGAAYKNQARRRALLRLHALYGGGEEGADAALRLDRVTGPEMYFLASMYFSFHDGAGGPGRALATGRHAWVSVDARRPTGSPGWYVRASLARSAGLRTVVFVPCKGGVLELGSVVDIRENPEVVRAIQSAFLAKPAASPDDHVRIFGKDISRGASMPPVTATGWEDTCALRLGGQAMAAPPAVAKVLDDPKPVSFAKPVDERRPWKRRPWKPWEETLNQLEAEQQQQRDELDRQLYALRAVVPKVTKLDRASLLSDAVAYIQELEARLRDSQAGPAPPSVEVKAMQDKVVLRVTTPLDVHPISRAFNAIRDSQLSVVAADMVVAEDTVTQTLVVRSAGAPQLTAETMLAALSRRTTMSN